MTDNETIIQVLAETSQVMRAHMLQLMEAEAPPSVIHRYLEAWANVSGIVNELGDRRPDPRMIAAHPDGLFEVLNSVSLSLESIHARLMALESPAPKSAQGL